MAEGLKLSWNQITALGQGFFSEIMHDLQSDLEAQGEKIPTFNMEDGYPYILLAGKVKGSWASQSSPNWAASNKRMESYVLHASRRCYGELIPAIFTFTFGRKREFYEAEVISQGTLHGSIHTFGAFKH